MSGCPKLISLKFKFVFFIEQAQAYEHLLPFHISKVFSWHGTERVSVCVCMRARERERDWFLFLARVDRGLHTQYKHTYTHNLSISHTHAHLLSFNVRGIRKHTLTYRPACLPACTNLPSVSTSSLSFPISLFFFIFIQHIYMLEISTYTLFMFEPPPPYTPGVANTRPAGRMWPARCVCAARNIIKITQIIAETTVFVV